MKHISKFDGCVYEISESVDLEAIKNNKGYRDDILLIWKDAPCDVDDAENAEIPLRELVGWYYGGYDYEDVEWQIKYYYRNKLEKKEQSAPKKPKTMDLPICYVNMISDCLETIKKHKLYALLSYDGDVETAQDHLEEVFERFCKPLEEKNEDLEIILED